MILALTPCPCLDRILHLEGRLEPHALHRVRLVEEVPGGKGLNLVRAVRRLGGEALALAPLGGYLGERVLALAQEEGLPLLPLPGRAGRACQILWDGEGATEVYEPCPPWALEGLPPLDEGVKVVAGSLPPGLSPEALLEAFRPQAVDSAALFPAALQARVGLIKPNREELRRLAPGEPLEAALRLHRAHGTALLVSLGGEGALYVGEEGVYRAKGPLRWGNPVGSGDTLLGVFLWQRALGKPLEEVLALGVAAATANVGRGGGRIAPEEVATLLQEVEVRKL
jgi:1-phosphofructokinase